MHRRPYALAVLALALAGSPALAQSVWYRTVPAGGRYAAQNFVSINPDCSLVGYATVRIVTPAANGVVHVYKGAAFPNFPRSNPRSACSRRRVPAMMLEYRPNRGFVGSDRFVLDVFLPGGIEDMQTYNINVK